VQIDFKGSLDAEFRGSTPGIQFRYAEVLLNYAEALAELDGAANAAKIVELVSPLRKRVGMPEMDFDREYNTSADYPFHALDKYLQAVRRERRVELAIEGKRFDDIMPLQALHEDDSQYNRYFSVTLKEGRNREVRRLWEAVGCQVSRLKRIRFGNVTLPKELAQGRYRLLTPGETNALLEPIRPKKGPARTPGPR